MEIFLLVSAVIYLAVGFLVALIGKGLLEERGLGTPEEREMMAWLILFLWPLYGFLYGAWRLLAGAASILRPRGAVRGLALGAVLVALVAILFRNRLRRPAERRGS